MQQAGKDRRTETLGKTQRRVFFLEVVGFVDRPKGAAVECEGTQTLQSRVDLRLLAKLKSVLPASVCGNSVCRMVMRST